MLQKQVQADDFLFKTQINDLFKIFKRELNENCSKNDKTIIYKKSNIVNSV